jgi:hypothetical protein
MNTANAPDKSSRSRCLRPKVVRPSRSRRPKNRRGVAWPVEVLARRDRTMAPSQSLRRRRIRPRGRQTPDPRTTIRRTRPRRTARGIGKISSRVQRRAETPRGLHPGLKSASIKWTLHRMHPEYCSSVGVHHTRCSGPGRFLAACFLALARIPTGGGSRPKPLRTGHHRGNGSTARAGAPKSRRPRGSVYANHRCDGCHTKA